MRMLSSKAMIDDEVKVRWVHADVLGDLMTTVDTWGCQQVQVYMVDRVDQVKAAAERVEQRL